MNPIACKEEAEDCRRKALTYLGQPEAPFLLRIAREFDRLAAGHTGAPNDRREEA